VAERKVWRSQAWRVAAIRKRCARGTSTRSTANGNSWASDSLPEASADLCKRRRRPRACQGVLIRAPEPGSRADSEAPAVPDNRELPGSGRATADSGRAAADLEPRAVLAIRITIRQVNRRRKPRPRILPTIHPIIPARLSNRTTVSLRRTTVSLHRTPASPRDSGHLRLHW